MTDRQRAEPAEVSAGQEQSSAQLAAERSAAQVAEVRKKAVRMAKARQDRPTLWRHLAHMGTLGWLFILPAVGLSAAGRYLSQLLELRWLAIAGVGSGIAVGSYLVFRNIQRSLLEAEEEDR